MSGYHFVGGLNLDLCSCQLAVPAERKLAKDVALMLLWRSKLSGCCVDSTLSVSHDRCCSINGCCYINDQ